MQAQKAWLKCEVTPGMFPAEYAVNCNNIEGNAFSFFASEDYIKPLENLVQVDLLDCQHDICLINVPFDPLEGISRTVKVHLNSLVGIKW